METIVSAMLLSLVLEKTKKAANGMLINKRISVVSVANLNVSAMVCRNSFSTVFPSE